MNKWNKHNLRKGVKGYAFISLFLIGFFCFFLIPCIQSFKYSLGTLSYASGFNFEFGGFANYYRAFRVDAKYIRVLLSSLTDTVVNVPIVCIFAFLMAYFVKDDIPGRNFFRSVLFLPVLISSGVIASMDANDMLQNNMMMLDSESNMLSSASMVEFLADIGLGEEISQYIMYAVDNVFDVTSNSGVQMLICLTALQSISPSLYEASAIEGATGWESFWKITFPLVTPQLLVCVFYTIISQMLSVGNTIIAYINEINFVNFELGYGSALAWSYFVVVSAVLAAFLGSLALLSKRYR